MKKDIKVKDNHSKNVGIVKNIIDNQKILAFMHEVVIKQNNSVKVQVSK